MIFEELGPESASGRLALSRLAVTCEGFLDPALDLLWRKQTSLIPLLRCIYDIWMFSEEPDEPPLEYFALAASVLPEDWDRVLFYSKRIKFLHVEPIGSGLSLEILELFSMSVPKKFIMPNLQHISWNPEEDSWFPYIRLFLGPKITSIDIMLFGGISRIALLPFITFDGDLLAYSISAMIDSLSGIQTLYLPFIDAPSFPHLASLPTLISLTIDDLGGYAPLSEQFFRHHSSRPFPALRILRLYHVDTLTDVQSFLHMLSVSDLVEFELSAQKAFTEGMLLDLLSSLNAHCSRTSLSNVDIRVAGTTNAIPTPALPFPWTTLRSLLAFPNLSRVRVESVLGFSIDDNFIVEMATAWPLITSLILSPGLHPLDVPPITPSILSLESFAQLCPHLQHLCIPLDAASLRQPPGESNTTHQKRQMQTALETLDVGNAAIGSPLAVASFLCSMFPALRQINATSPQHGADAAGGGNGQNERHLNWQEVQRLLPIVRAIRKEEENYWREEFSRNCVS
ncbi:hypothetical protein B0H19DRAFT_1260670 [Mycena capillaripes]|nr:hypothetical protein B0H19DRAFT_1260670 [Mycena capillaripes]